ncbi:hypothetical protein CJ260_00785 [Megasphaera sp. ASD88]|uniref:hypothetical protein n=1 Tax=Megasphaera sp. ASD88 TaxID=2027407 RepID=UPI000BABAEE0|nr:hypothetical protein [Megasphaera sp. ASD88]PAV40007.1 hypothetical protein CJ260_00785 [Megasphaera sp. ASD88]
MLNTQKSQDYWTKKFTECYGSTSEVAEQYANILGIDSFDIEKVVNAALCITCNREYYKSLQYAANEINRLYEDYGFLTYGAMIRKYEGLVYRFKAYEKEKLTSDESYIVACVVADFQVDDWKKHIEYFEIKGR